MLEVRARQGDQEAADCPLCREALAGVAELHACPGCATRMHLVCASELGGCPTLGCQHRGQRPAQLAHWFCRACHQPIASDLTRRRCRCGASLHGECLEAHGACPHAGELRDAARPYLGGPLRLDEPGATTALPGPGWQAALVTAALLVPLGALLAGGGALIDRPSWLLPGLGLATFGAVVSALAAPVWSSLLRPAPRGDDSRGGRLPGSVGAALALGLLLAPLVLAGARLRALLGTSQVELPLGPTLVGSYLAAALLVVVASALGVADERLPARRALREGLLGLLVPLGPFLYLLRLAWRAVARPPRLD